MDQKIAVIDLGTNTFHLLIAEYKRGRYEIVRRERRASKVGVGGINSGIITADGIERAIVALKFFRTVLDQESITRVVAIGTSAFRNAKNGDYVAALIEQQTGIYVDIISGDTEAGYIYQGVCDAIPLGEQRSVIMDIGGGSVEFIIGTGSKIFWKHSFEIGGQRLLEMFHRHDPILGLEVQELNGYLANTLQPVLAQLETFNPRLLVGSSGTFDTLSEIYCFHHKLPYEPDAPETPMTMASFYETYDLLVTKSRAERMRIPGMIEMRVEMIVVACCLIRFMLDNHPFDTIRVSTYSLKEGVLQSLAPRA